MENKELLLAKQNVLDTVINLRKHLNRFSELKSTAAHCLGVVLHLMRNDEIMNN